MSMGLQIIIVLVLGLGKILKLEAESAKSSGLDTGLFVSLEALMAKM
jgi:hypothetical protein